MSLRKAVDYVHQRDKRLANARMLSFSTLQRYCVALPEALRCGTDWQLLEWIQAYDSGRRRDLSAAHCGAALLTALEEELIAQWIHVMATVNLGVGRAEVIERARGCLLSPEGLLPEEVERIKNLKLINWYKGFRNRQSGLSDCKERLVTPARLLAETKVGSIEHFFTLLSQFKDYKADQIYAGDETGISGDGTRPRLVLCRTGFKQVRSAKVRVKGHVGLMHVGNAAGDSLPPVVAYTAKGLTDEHLRGLPRDALVREQENGHLVGKDFRAVLEHILNHARRPGGVWHCANAERPPLVFIVDGASCHTDLEALVWAKLQRLDILCLPSNMTHLLQVADVSLFAPFKRYWAAACGREMLKNRQRVGSTQMDVSVVVQCMMEAWNRAMTPANVKAGFERTGMFPFNPEAHKLLLAPSHLGSLGGLPLLIEADAQSLLLSPSISSIVESFHDAVPRPEPEAATPKRRATKRLSTENGCLLTAAELLASLEARRVEAARVDAEKATKRRDRDEKKVVRQRAKAAKATAKADAAVASAAAVKATETALTAVRPSGEPRADQALILLPKAVIVAALAAKGQTGPEAWENWERRRDQRQAEVREAAAAAVAAATVAAAATATPTLQVERPAQAFGDLTNVAKRGQKRKAAPEAEAGKENGHGHDTRAKAARGQGVRRGLETVLEVSI